MDTVKLLEIIRITFPVFALLGLGNILSRTGKMTDAHQSFLNWFVYFISLPALIFVGMATQPFSSLLNTDFIFATLLSMLAIFLIYILISVILRLDKKIAVVMIFCTYWSNVAYMGFPLAESAYGEHGFLLAAVVNAVSMPIFVIVSFVMIGLCADDKKGSGIVNSIRAALVNPILLASFAGIAYAWVADALGFGAGGGASLPIAFEEAFWICEIILKNVGTMGLSLALIAVGGKLRFRSFGKNVLPMLLSVVGKLLILPLITLVIMKTLFPSSPKDVVGVAVLLMTLPTAVTVAVIAAQFKLDEEFTSSILAVSLLGGVVMIPFWLYIVL
ncbi:MAG: AEC family transporter [Chitinispirillales bacterium]|jgi:predicted permease|nr:AEC family transporter [Chitinispirillales bacterium]